MTKGIEILGDKMKKISWELLHKISFAVTIGKREIREKCSIDDLKKQFSFSDTLEREIP